MKRINELISRSTLEHKLTKFDIVCATSKDKIAKRQNTRDRRHPHKSKKKKTEMPGFMKLCKDLKERYSDISKAESERRRSVMKMTKIESLFQCSLPVC